ncbi:putative sigma factor [Janibacter sp. HTCC2649]|uniref:RNA polymerase sigma factor n=1 Tax=Janibacter sp. HTCC2649 TaxID=313589 RepID=UPI0000670D26|nr:sigma-70 family RNA polymerase sigma factor [Janibacter sp. HTCC2649]EAQ00758.1 putative sigma factor [Janibacter sp. HTCC2649]
MSAKTSGQAPAGTPAERRLEELARVQGPRVLSYLARRTTPREDAADVYQAVLTTTWRKIHKVPESTPGVEGGDAALGWMLAVARRELANHRRSASRRLAATDRLRGELTAYPMQGNGTAAEGDGHDHVHDAVAGLDADDREIVTLTYWDGLTSAQVAAATGLSASAVRKRLERARQRLAQHLVSRDTTAARGVTERYARA